MLPVLVFSRTGCVLCVLLPVSAIKIRHWLNRIFLCVASSGVCVCVCVCACVFVSVWVLLCNLKESPARNGSFLEWGIVQWYMRSIYTFNGAEHRQRPCTARVRNVVVRHFQLFCEA